MMDDEYVHYSTEEEGTFVDRQHHVVPKKDPDEEDAEPQMCPPAEHETSPDCVVGLEEDRKQKKRKRRKKKQKKAAQTPSVSSSITWAGSWKWLGILCLVGLLFFAAYALLSSAGDKLGIGARELDDVTYKPVSEDVCAAIVKVKEAPITMKKDEEEVPLDCNVRCPHTQEHFGVNVCFESDSTLRVEFKKGGEGLLFIEHGKERNEALTIRLDHEACSSSVEDRSAATPSTLGQSDSHNSSKGHLKAQDTPVNGAPSTSEGSGVTMKVGGFGALFLVFSLPAAFLFVFGINRYRKRLLARAVAHTENGQV